MQLIRRMESAASNLYKEKKNWRFLSSVLRPACAVGIKAAMTDGDAVITSYRCHGWTLLHGASVSQVLSELTGRMAGVVHGKGGSMHMFEKDFYGGNGIVGAQQALGTGIAFAMKYKSALVFVDFSCLKITFNERICRKQKNICLTLYGDGAANQGQLYESTNMAMLWNLPVVYVCENNGFGMGTQAERSSASTDYYMRGDYVPGLWVDSMDVLAVREAIRWAKDYCNAGKGPLVLELATYRYSGHSMSDPGTSYRTREEIQEVRKTRDPITGFKDRLITSGLAKEDDLKAIDKEVRKEVDDAVKVAVTAPLLPEDGIYADIRGVTIDESHVQKYVNSTELLKAINK
ncbi:dehydrogenase E1 component [Ostertagia ostertagi]